MTDKYSDIRMQNTITTVVEPTVSARLGNETFFSSARTSATNNRIESVMRLNIGDSVFYGPSLERSQRPPNLNPITSTSNEQFAVEQA